MLKKKKAMLEEKVDVKKKRKKKKNKKEKIEPLVSKTKKKRKKRKKKSLTSKQISKLKRKELREKTKKLKILKKYFEQHRKVLNKLDYTIWCNKCSFRLIMGVCLYRKLNISDIINYRYCNKCTVYISNYIKVLDFIDKNEKSFMDLCINNKVELTDINIYVERWHNSYEGIQSLSSYLGMTWKEYDVWIKKPKLLEFIINLRKEGKSDQILSILRKEKEQRKQKRLMKKKKKKKTKKKVILEEKVDVKKKKKKTKKKKKRRRKNDKSCSL